MPKIINYNKTIHNNLRLLLKKVINFLEEHKITYWIFSGTLLGYVRHDKKFIHHDDDIDLVIYENNIDEIFKTMEKNNIFNINDLKIDNFFWL